MAAKQVAFKQQSSSAWTRERIDNLGKKEIEQLRVNAERLGEASIVSLCDESLKGRPKVSSKAGSAALKKANGNRLISRVNAFSARGVRVNDPRTSWGGVRKSDGMVVLTLWADAVKSTDGSCRYLLWSPNTDGKHPWADSDPGKERLKHCQTIMENGAAEGLLVYGEALDGHLPEDKVRSVHGVDPETVLRFKVEKEGDSYWAVWGKKA